MENEVLQFIRENLQFLLISAIVIAAVLGVSTLCERTILAKNIVKVRRTQYVTVCGMLGAIAAILYLFDFSVAFLAPGFYKLDFSELPVMIGAFYLGPVGGVIIELVKMLLKLVFRWTDTALVGEFANLVVGCSFAVPAAIIYHLRKTKKTAKLSLVVGTICMAVFGSAFNAIYLIPAFATLYGIPLDVIVGMGTAINPSITSVWTLALFSVAPLNLLKGVLISVPTMLLYKRISKILQNAAQGHRVPESRTEN